MKTKKQASTLDETTRKRITKLQWKKEVKEPEERVAAVIVDVLYEEDWIKNRYNKADKQERSLFRQFFEFALNSLAGDDYDRFRERVQPLFNEATRQNIEEVQHVSIANALNKLVKEKNRLPARCEIVADTGYSHKTVNRCLATYEGSFIHKGRKEELTLMREKMLSVCYQYGIRGDMKAAKLFLEATAEKPRQSCHKAEQNNFIQINGYTITPEQLLLLPQEKQRQIQDILGLLNSPLEELSSNQ